MSGSTAEFIQAPPGSTVDFRPIYERTWHQLDVLSLADGQTHALDGTAEQYLIFVIRGTGVASWDGVELPLARGKAFGVPQGEQLTLTGTGASDTCDVAVVCLAGTD